MEASSNSEPTFETLMMPPALPNVGEDCMARSYLRTDNYYGRRADGLCIVCRVPLPKRRLRYCSDECGRWFTDNHDWTMASRAALVSNAKSNFTEDLQYNPFTKEHYIVLIPCCSRCKKPQYNYYFDRRDMDWRQRLDDRLEVDHIIPLNGGNRNKTCMNHQTNLRVVCHRCHLLLTKEQRAAGLIT